MNELIVVNKKKRFDYRHIICIAITLGFIACTVFRFFGAIGRMVEGGRDFGLSIAYYFCEIFGLNHHIVPIVNELPTIPFFEFGAGSFEPSTTLPDTWSGFKSDWSLYWHLWASKDNFVSYVSSVGNFFFIFCQVLLLIIPFIFIFT